MISLSKAKKAVEAAEKKATELGIKITICITDRYGLTVLSSRMDDALPISARFAFSKAYTASVLQMPTNKLAEFAQPGKPYYGVTSIWDGRFTTIPGGVTVAKKNKVIGGVGVGGGMPSQDKECAEVAAKILNA